MNFGGNSILQEKVLLLSIYSFTQNILHSRIIINEHNKKMLKKIQNSINIYIHIFIYVYIKLGGVIYD